MAAEIGYLDKAEEYFDFAATMDVADVGVNMKHGAQIASIGGTWMAVAYGFGGLRDHGGKLTFCPRLAAGWSRLKFRLTVRNNLISLVIKLDTTAYRLCAGEGLSLAHRGQQLEPTPG